MSSNRSRKRYSRTRVVILGGGFAGVECTKRLESYFQDDWDVELVLVSENNFLLFTPMLPQVASGMVETSHIITPIRAICEAATFYEGSIKNIDPYEKLVNLYGTGDRRGGLTIRYDYLVVALGSKTDFFGMKDVEKHAYPMKTLNDAILLRNRAISMLEQSVTEFNSALRKSMLTFVIAGGGFAGIETAGELMDLLRDASKYYPDAYMKDLNVTVVHRGSSLIPGFSDKLAEFTYNAATKRGIKIMLNASIAGFDGNKVTLRRKAGGGEEPETDFIRANTLVWTAGISPIDAIRDSYLKTNDGKVVVNDFLESSEFPGVFAAGDCAMCIDPKTEQPFPPTVHVAEMQAKFVADNIYAMIRGKKRRKVDFKPKAHMAIIGKRSGIASLLGANITGFWPWLLWRNAYVIRIPRMEKRIRVITDWALDALFDRDISTVKYGGAAKQGENEP